METQRPQAPYLPSNLEFVAKNNAFTPEQLKQNMLNGELMAVIVGFFCGKYHHNVVVIVCLLAERGLIPKLLGNTVSLPVDPRQRMSSPKTNPSRVFTPEGTFGWGGSCASIYPVDVCGNIASSISTADATTSPPAATKCSEGRFLGEGLYLERLLHL